MFLNSLLNLINYIIMMSHNSQTHVIRKVDKSQTPVTEWVTPVLPLDQAGCVRLRHPPPRQLMPVDEIKGLHELARTGDYEKLLGTISSLAREYSTSDLATVLMAIDPSTGDTLFHTGIRSQHPTVLSYLKKTFSPNGSCDLSKKALFRHQNHAGETMIHAAVKTGKIDMLVSAYRLFAQEPLVHEQRLGNWDDWAEYRTDMGDEEIAFLTFLLEKDSEGRDAATVARGNGHISLARWIDDVVTRLDPDGQRYDPEQRKMWEDWIRDYYQHIERH